MKRFRLLLSGQALSTLGDILYILALVTTLYRQSGSAAVAALFPLLRVAGLTAGSFGAPLVLGRFRLGRLLAGCLLGQSAGMAALALYLNAAGHPQIAWLTAAVFVLSVAEGVAGPARSSILPRLVDKERLLKANGTLGAVVETCSLAGWAAGAIVIARFGAGPSLWASAALLLLAGLAAAVMGDPVVSDRTEKAKPERTGSSLLAGWRMLVRVPSLRVLLWMDVWQGLFASGFAGALLLVFAREQLHTGEEWWGWMNGAFCLGLIAANAAIGRYVPDAAKRLSLLLTLGAAGMGMSVLGFSFLSMAWTALPVLFVIGIAESAVQLGSRTLMQLSVSEREQPPVFAAQYAVTAAVYGISLLLTGWMADNYGIRPVYVCAAACYFIAFLGASRGRRIIGRTGRFA